MKLLIFAHTPPPYHGQSVIVKLLLDGLAPGCEQSENIVCYHVNARVSDDLSDVGRMRPLKLIRLLGFCGEAVWCRLRYGVNIFYYIPAPAKRGAIIRDWLVMILVRPWFKQTIFHWHASGLGRWAAAANERSLVPSPRLFGVLEPAARKITRCLLGRPNLSLVLTESNRADAELLTSCLTAVIPNGIPDPCPDFLTEVLPGRQQRLELRRKRQISLKVLFLASCTRAKGLFDALSAVEAAYEQGIPIVLSIAGAFPDKDEEEEFKVQLNKTKLGKNVQFLGFLTGPAKDIALRTHDILLAPSHHESFGLTAVEAMAYGLPAIVTKSTGLGEVMGPAWKAQAPIGDTLALSRELIALKDFPDFSSLRTRYLRNFEVGLFFRRLRSALIKTQDR